MQTVPMMSKSIFLANNSMSEAFFNEVHLTLILGEKYFAVYFHSIYDSVISTVQLHILMNFHSNRSLKKNAIT